MTDEAGSYCERGDAQPVGAMDCIQVLAHDDGDGEDEDERADIGTEHPGSSVDPADTSAFDRETPEHPQGEVADRHNEAERRIAALRGTGGHYERDADDGNGTEHDNRSRRAFVE